MKRLLMTTALVIGTAGFAAAQNEDMLRDRVETYFDNTQTDVVVSSLSDEQVNEIYIAITSSDDAAQRREDVDAVLADMGVIVADDGTVTMEEPGYVLVDEVEMPRDQIHVRVSNYFEDHPQIEADADMLSDEQLAAAYVAITSTDDTAAQMEGVRAAIQ